MCKTYAKSSSLIFQNLRKIDLPLPYSSILTSHTILATHLIFLLTVYIKIISILLLCRWSYGVVLYEIFTIGNMTVHNHFIFIA